MMEKDPVCGMLVRPEEAAGKRDHEGRPYYFCSIDCLGKFDLDPRSYVATPGGTTDSGDLSGQSPKRN